MSKLKLRLVSIEEFVGRFGNSAMPLDDKGQRDDRAILRAIEDAALLAQSELGATEISGVESLVALCVCDIAFYRLHDRVSSNEEARTRYTSALETLRSLSSGKRGSWGVVPCRVGLSPKRGSGEFL